MKTMLLGLAGAAALSLAAAPAAAGDSNGGWNGSNGGGVWIKVGDGNRDRDRDRDRRGHRQARGDVVASSWHDGDWAYHNNRSFSSDSYNDWWHDRPDRAYPRWMQNNQDCQRVWWSGGGWRC